MGYFIAIAVVAIAAVLGKSLIGYSLVTPLVLAVSFKTDAQRSFLVAFLAGLGVSLTGSTLLGRESLGLVLAAAMIHLYGGRFSRRHWAFTFFFAGLGSIIITVVAGRTFLLGSALVDAVLSLLFLPLVGFWQELFFAESMRLKV